jgi:MoxR-like ATPase
MLLSYETNGDADLHSTERALAPIHGFSYVSPSLVALAAKKIYPHRIVITTPENERSMQWGSSLDAVRAVLEGVTAEDVIEEVLHAVEVPL